MEPEKKGVATKVLLAALLLIIPAGILAYLFNKKDTAVVSDLNNADTEPVVNTETPTSTSTDEDDSVYKDGVYSATGNYVSPGGAEEVGVTVTLKDDIITTVEVALNSPRPTSQEFQGIFAANYKPLVLGKNIDDVELSKVSGSSLTSQGFNDALLKIKTEAKS